MTKVAIAFSTKDRVELSRRSIEPLLHHPKLFDLFLVDGSTTDEGKQFCWDFHKGLTPLRIVENIRGGADAAIVHNLTFILQRGEQYTHVGLVENDVLLTDPDWFARTMALFEIGRADGLVVGAASARCFADRILLQRDGYAVMHNLGAGMVILTREAAELILRNYRTGWTTNNRAVFSILSGIDIGRYWAFKGGEHWITADWHFDTILAAHGLASLALTPSPVEMIGQVPPIEEQGLQIVDKQIDEFCNYETFMGFCDRLNRVQAKLLTLPDQLWHRDCQGEIIFAHQIASLDGYFQGDWRLQWSQGFGPFAWQAGASGGPPDALEATARIPVFGSCHVLVRGGNGPTRIKIQDTYSGFDIEPTLQPGIMMAAHVPSGQQYRAIKVTALDPGAIFHGVQCVLPQPRVLQRSFDWSVLPQC